MGIWGFSDVKNTNIVIKNLRYTLEALHGEKEDIMFLDIKNTDVAIKII